MTVGGLDKNQLQLIPLILYCEIIMKVTLRWIYSSLF